MKWMKVQYNNSSHRKVSIQVCVYICICIIRRVLQEHRVKDRNERLHSKQPEYHPSLIVLCLFILLLLIRCHCHKKGGLLIAKKWPILCTSHYNFLLNWLLNI